MNRDEQEAALAAALMASWRKFDGKDEVSWPQFQAAIRPALVQNLSSIYVSSAKAEAGDYDLPGLERVAEHWADGYSRRLAAEITRTSREQIEAAKRKKDRDELGLALAIMLGSDRADMIAITETTSATTAGQNTAASYLDRLLGRKSIAYWECEDDACDVCLDVDGEPHVIWADLFPSGPPAHPHCRCRLRYRVE